MKEKIRELQEEIKAFHANNKDELEQFRLRFLSKKGEIPSLFTEFKNVSPDQKKELGKPLNELKQEAENKYQTLKEQIEEQGTYHDAFIVNDLTLPTIPGQPGARHPLSRVKEQIVTVFERLGFNLSEGPEVEDDWHNFSALNFPYNHPAREMQDTFFVEKDPDIALRTHTSSVQVRVMESQEPPIRTLSPGRVYRNEAISARAHCVFHQIEGLYVDEQVSFADLKQTMYHFAREMFGKDTKIRLRPSFFPFTEPSAELDVYWGGGSEEDDRVTKGTGWLEIGGCGMVDPNVLENCGIDSSKYSGFAFGVGIERIAMLKFNIKDLRLFTENDVRFLKQFKSFI